MKRHIVASLSLSLALVAATADAQPKPLDQPAQTTKPLPGSGVKTNPAPSVDPWAGRTDLFVAPNVTPTTKVTLGPIDRFTLKNGLQVIVVARPSVPIIDVTLAIKAGKNADPIGRSGLAQFTASMLRKGTKTRTADQIAETVDFVGAELEASSSDDHTVVTCHARSKDLPLCLSLTDDIVENPAFPESEMGEIADQLNASVEAAKDTPARLAAEHAANLYFGDEDPRGRPISKVSLAAIDRAQLAAFHKTWYAPNNALLTVSGDVDAKSVRKQLEQAFGRWKKHSIPADTDKNLPSAKGPLMVRLVDKPDATQSTIVIVGPGIAHRSPDYYAVRLMSWALGSGGFSSRLMKVVRSDGAKTYGANAGFQAGLYPGPFTASTFTRNAETANTLKLVLDTIAEMRAKGPTEAELKAAKGNLIGGYGLRLETAGDLARALVTSALDKMDAQAVEKYPERLNAVTLADAAKAAAAHLEPAALVVVGRADEVKPQLEKAGYHVTDVVGYSEPVSAAERRAAAAAREKSGHVSAAEADAGHALLQIALAAKGGDLLGKVKDMSMTGKGTMSMGPQQVPIAVQQYQLPGKAARQDISIGPMKMIQIVAGGKATVKRGEQLMELPPEAAKEMQRGLWRDANFILLYAAQPTAKVRALPAISDGGVRYDALEIISPEGDATRVWLDPKTHLIARLSYDEGGKKTQELFSDYRPEGGIAIPHKMSESGGGQQIEITYDKVELNKGLPDTTFKP